MLGFDMSPEALLCVCCWRLARLHGVGGDNHVYVRCEDALTQNSWSMRDHGNTDFNICINACKFLGKLFKTQRKNVALNLKQMLLYSIFFAFWHFPAHIEISCTRSINPCKFLCKMVIFDSIPKYTIFYNSRLCSTIFPRCPTALFLFESSEVPPGKFSILLRCCLVTLSAPPESIFLKKHEQ